MSSNPAFAESLERRRLFSAIITGPRDIPPQVGNLVSAGERVFFTIKSDTASLDTGGWTELWTSDGTPGSTRSVHRFATSDRSYGYSDPMIAVSNGSVFLTVDDGRHGRELWTSDGTVEGTHLVKDIHAGSKGSEPQALFDFNGTLLFSSDDGVHGAELWKTDGTDAGTLLVKELSPGSTGSSLTKFVRVGRKFFFLDDRQITISDGTEAGTHHLIDAAGYAVVSDYSYAAAVGGRYVVVTSTRSSMYIASSDGTPGGTTSFKVGDGADATTAIYVTNRYAYFRAALNSRNEPLLWRSDGTLAGTGPVKIGGKQLLADPLGTIGSKLVYATGPQIDGATPQLRTLDDASSTTALLLDLPADPANGIGHGGFVRSGRWTYFTATDPSSKGSFIYRTDGSTGGTRVMWKLADGAQSAISGLVAGGHRFFALDTFDYDNQKLWTLDQNEKKPEIIDPYMPSATLSGSTDFATDGATTLKFTLVFGNSLAEKVSGITGNSKLVHVTGPNGFDAWARYIDGDGKRQARYKITPPGAALDAADVGTYNVTIAGGIVRNAHGTMPTRTIGALRVSAPSGSITGTIYDDANASAVRDPGEDGLMNQTVFLDVDGDGRRDRGEPSALTDSSGTYRFDHLIHGTYRVRAALGEEWYPTTGWPRPVARDDRVTTADLAAAHAAVFGGVVFNDADSDAQQDTGEAGVEGVKVFLDTDRDGLFDDYEPIATTNAQGRYTIGALHPSSGDVRLVPLRGWRQVSTIASPTLSNGDRRTFDIARGKGGRISGNTLSEENYGGFYHKPLASRTVYLDANDNARLDDGEVSASTDMNGAFSFDYLASGSYVLRTVRTDFTLEDTARRFTLGGGEEKVFTIYLPE